jgi:hypothetical protein
MYYIFVFTEQIQQKKGKNNENILCFVKYFVWFIFLSNLC